MRIVQTTMTPDELAAWERGHSDKRSLVDRTCIDCEAPITRYSTTGRCHPCAAKQAKRRKLDGPPCVKCGVLTAGHSPVGLCVRCGAAEAGRRVSKPRTVTPAQRWVGSRNKFPVKPLEGDCVHHMILGASNEGVVYGKCRDCGYEREYRPYEGVYR